MNDKGPFYAYIEDYLTGRLTPEQQAAMRQALRDDPDLAREVELRRLEFEVSETLIAGTIRDQLRGLRTEPPPATPPVRHVYWLLAALLCIVAFAIYWWAARTPAPAPEPAPPIPRQTPAPAPAPVPQAQTQPAPAGARPAAPARRYLALATELYQKPDFESLRGPAAPADSALTAALAAWQQQDYTGVLAALRNAPGDTDPKYLRTATLRAHALYQLQRYKEAAQGFRDIARRNVQPWAEEAEGYLLLALLADGQTDTDLFRNQLRRLLDDPGHPWAETAKTMQQRLNER